MFKSLPNFIIIDDDSCHNIVCALSLKKAFKPININIVGFTDVREGIHFIEKNVGDQMAKTVLFLDIHMPELSGWDVLAAIEAMPKEVKNNLIVYMLSSSLTRAKRIKALTYPFVKGCLTKPLSEHMLDISEEITEMALQERMLA